MREYVRLLKALADSTVSKHLSPLREAGFVEDQKERRLDKISNNETI